MKKRKLKLWVKIFILIILLLMLAFSIYNLVLYFIDSKSIEKIENEINLNISTGEIDGTDNAELVNPPKNKTSDYWAFIETPYIDVNFDELLSRNSDTVAWLQVNNTNVNYPIVQTNNNSDYLKRAFNKSYNSAGWLFMDYRNDSTDFGTNTIIYGHSMLNTTMFGTLLKAKKASWYTNKDNWVIKLSTPTEYTLWQIFSLYSTEAESYYITTDFIDNKEISNFFNKLLSRSKYNFNTTLADTDKILTLSTCTSAGTDGRFVIHAKLIKREKKEN